MAHFYTTAQGNRGEVSRCGSKASGAEAAAQGWNIGGRVIMKYDPKYDTDIVYFYRTRGSNRYGAGTLVAAFAIIDNEWKCLTTDLPELFV